VDTRVVPLRESSRAQIHQPSAQLFERFDRLLFLAKGGRTVYFGEVGRGSHTLIDYFTSHGATPCPKEANPAEWMLQVIGAAPGTQTDVDWPQVWQDSAAKREVRAELQRMKMSGVGGQLGSLTKSNEESGTFAASYSTQFIEVTKRVARFYWRNPAYIYSKLVLVVATVSSESNEPDPSPIGLMFCMIQTIGSVHWVFLL